MKPVCLSRTEKYPENQIEYRLLESLQEFDQLYTLIKSLADRIEQFPGSVTRETVQALLHIIQSDQYETKKQRYFLYKEAADLLVSILTGYQPAMGKEIIHALESILIRSRNNRQRAIAEALGALPVNIKGPSDIRPGARSDILTLKFDRLLEYFNDPGPGSFAWHGRTLRFENREGTIGCIKFARSEEDVPSIELEIQWLKFLKSAAFLEKDMCHIPTPLVIDQYCLFRLTDIPANLTKGSPPVPDRYPAIVYTTIDAYYDYPNNKSDAGFSKNRITDIFCRCATLLGTFMANGVIHTAIIPLFHNRIQQTRRQDNGFYLWEHGGRLDQWLKSCQFPNFAFSGLRDFEHLKILKRSTEIRHFSGEYLLGLFLVMGSIFRNMAPHKIGRDEQGVPYDLRHLFDEDFFYNTLLNVIEKYYQAVTGLPMENASCLLTRKLIRLLIEAMGIDVHMEEVLRVQDQLNMDPDTFNEFLISRGYTREAIEQIKKGENDIILTTGPHLGGFNQSIPVPELIEFLFCFSALCVAGRYQHENGLNNDVRST